MLKKIKKITTKILQDMAMKKHFLKKLRFSFNVNFVFIFNAIPPMTRPEGDLTQIIAFIGLWSFKQWCISLLGIILLCAFGCLVYNKYFATYDSLISDKEKKKLPLYRQKQLDRRISLNTFFFVVLLPDIVLSSAIGVNFMLPNWVLRSSIKRVNLTPIDFVFAGYVPSKGNLFFDVLFSYPFLLFGPIILLFILGLIYVWRELEDYPFAGSSGL